MKPLAIDLYGGLGGWAEGFLAEGYHVIGFDIEAHDYGTGGYPGELVLRDVRSITGAELVRTYGIPAVIVASPPCVEPSYRAMPWKEASAIKPPNLPVWWSKSEYNPKRKPKADSKVQMMTPEEMAEWKAYQRDHPLPPPEHFMALFDSCFRIQREASEAAGRYIPLIVENVRGAQKWVGRARWHFGSYYLWGDVPALMPPVIAQKFNPDGTTHGPGSWFAIADSKNRGVRMKSNAGTYERTEGPGRPRFIQEGKKVPGIKLSEVGFNVAAAQRYRAAQTETKGVKVSGDWFGSYADMKANGTISPGRLHGKNSDSRKAASAMIAKIPFPLAQYIARCFKPETETLA